MKVILRLEEKNKIIQYLCNNGSILIDMSIKERKSFLRKAKNMLFFENKLYYKVSEDDYRLVVAEDENETLSRILDDLHLPDHTGMKAMYEKSKTLYIGFKREKINSFVSQCLVCNRHRPLRRTSPIIPIISDHPWQLVQMDCIDLRNYSEDNDGYGWILNIIDCHSKFLFPFPLKNKTALAVKNALSSLVYREGSPAIIQTDNGREFNNEILINYLNERNIRYKRGRPRHPQNQGQVERSNQTLVSKLAKCLSNQIRKRWVDVIDEIAYKYNTTWHRAINKTPFEAFRNRLGINRPQPIYQESFADEDQNSNNEEEEINFIGNLEALESSSQDERMEEQLPSVLVENISPLSNVDEDYRQRYISRMQKDADVHYHRIRFNPGDKVLLKRDFDTNTQTRRRKMEDFYEEGVWEIKERVGQDNFKIQSLNDQSIVLVVCKNRLKKINS